MRLSTVPPVPADLSGLDLSVLLENYRAIVGARLRYMDDRMSDSTSFPGASRTVSDWWSSLDASGSAAGLRRGLDDGMKRLARLQHLYVTRHPAAAPAAAALTEEHLNVLREAVAWISMMDENLQSDWRHLGWRSLVEEAFGKGVGTTAALACFSETAATLERLVLESEVGKVNSGKGFVLDPGLPDSMAALAVGRGPESYIKLRPFMVTAATRAQVVAGLIPPLVHEGTHANEGRYTVDLIYRKQGLQAALTPDLRLKNAANYEQLAVDWLNAGIWQRIVGASPPKLTRTERAVVIMRLKVARAWVCADNVKVYEVRDGRMRFKYKNFRAVAAQLIGAEAATVGEVLSQVLFEELSDAADTLMKIVGDVRLEITDPPTVMVSVDGRVLGSIPDYISTAGEIASIALRLVVTDLARQGCVAFPVALLRWVDKVVDEDPFIASFSTAVTDFINGLATS
ncbi:hypothetical protein [Pseudofrankia inefficax]|uniref:Uncharacterized protein n=1 Tax=Pseudofrankia inefficax (strain DSM 45817 / CECT 9037 / DDB 130130 / EuI1c) TaxID=298654 RepID=E3J9M9_PSEI1|nr:hypothetical protein [Pseudofrankia inefficax]ADP84532.1 hypothetical protein FraEuI1c_6556 [Pseudofrankia inefficax]